MNNNESPEVKGKVSAFQIDKGYSNVGTQNGFQLWENGIRVYSPNNKPSATDVGALPITGGTLTGPVHITTTGTPGGGILGKGPDDVFLSNTTSNKYLQLKDNGNLDYAGNVVFVAGDPRLNGSMISTPQYLGERDLNVITSPGVYYQDMNVNALLERNYPVPFAGSLVVYAAAGVIQEYRVYSTSDTWTRANYASAVWTRWEKSYNTLNKPSAADIEALPITGGTVTGHLNSYALGVKQSEGLGDGISLYEGANAGKPNYGLMFAKTANFGGFGEVVGDWATYFTMTGGNDRGWIFNSDGGNVASISGRGVLAARGLSVYGSTAEVVSDDGNLHFWFKNASGAERGLIYAEGSTNNLCLRAAEGPRLYVKPDGTVHSEAQSYLSGFIVDGQRSGGSAGLIGGVVAGGGYADWQARATGLLVECVDSEHAATSIWKATQWDSYHLGGMDIHVPNGVISNAQLMIHVGDKDFRFDAGNSTLNGPGWNMSSYGPYCDRVGDVIDWAVRSFAPVSDSRLKQNIKPATKTALSDVDKIDFVSYEWVEDNNLTKDRKPTKLGITAQQMESIDSCYTKDIETFNSDGSIETSIKTLDVTNMLALALKSIQELTKLNTELAERVTALETTQQ